jgi:hypothetical protein
LGKNKGKIFDMCDLICGTYFKHQCRTRISDYIDERTPVFDYKDSEEGRENYVFCKPEFLQLLYDSKLLKDGSFTLVTHNSDVNFIEEYVEAVLELFPEIDHWYTQNLLCEHPKVSPIPIGIANPKWSHGNQGRFKKIMEENNEKDNLYYANFNISTNPPERSYCYKQLGIEPPTEYPNAASIKDHDEFVNNSQEDYLRKISESFFTVSPDGNGKDCHKTWEALYMKSIPIVTRWHGVEKFKSLGIPLIILDDWSEFKNLNLSKELYEETWGTFDLRSLHFENYLKN